MRLTTLVLTALLAAAAAGARAQGRAPVAALTPVAETDGVHAGTAIRLALQVRLPDGLHVQSNHPRDAALIATALTIEAPPGVTLDDVVYPAPIDLAQSGQAQPLSVFGEAFTIGVRLRLDAAIAPGDLVVPARLRYQACDATTCYIPARASAEWRLSVVAAASRITPQHQDVFAAIAFSRSAKP